MTPENPSEGQGTEMPEDVLFSDSESTTQDTPQPEAEADVQQADDVSEDTSPADALDDPSPSDALNSDEAKDDDNAAPESYEGFEIPEGTEGQFSEPVIAAFGDVAKELGLSQEQAQKVINAIGPAQLEAQQSVVTSAIDSWTKQTREDKEVGGTNYRASLANARRTVDRFGTPELKGLLTGKTTQLANHPEMLRLLSRVGKAISTDRSLVNGEVTKAKPDVNVVDPLSTPDATAELLFGDTQ